MESNDPLCKTWKHEKLPPQLIQTIVDCDLHDAANIGKSGGELISWPKVERLIQEFKKLEYMPTLKVEK